MFIVIVFLGFMIALILLLYSAFPTSQLLMSRARQVQMNENVSAEFNFIPISLKTKDVTESRMIQAQKISADIFKAIEERKLIVAGKTEAQLNQEIVQLALDEFGVDLHWHKKIVRVGVNTMAIYPDNPPDQIIKPDDIVILDYGIVFHGYEADYARTYVLGDDPMKIKLKKDVEKAWYEIQNWYRKQKIVKASDLFALTRQKAKEYGWESAGIIAGHIVGKYPHEQPKDPKSWELDVHPDNHNDILMRDVNGNKRHWILEVHFVDKANNMGGYFEQLL